MVNKYIPKEYHERIEYLRLKAERYYESYSNEDIKILNGRMDILSCKSIWINGLSEIEISELRMMGFSEHINY